MPKGKRILSGAAQARSQAHHLIQNQRVSLQLMRQGKRNGQERGKDKNEMML